VASILCLTEGNEGRDRPVQSMAERIESKETANQRAVKGCEGILLCFDVEPALPPARLPAFENMINRL
ncbi:MAG: hypothetical protein M3Q97_03580, partial [Bacteroidota bacterium]|nr:hypothetical protein [Bacteroidota bacterium]